MVDARTWVRPQGQGVLMIGNLGRLVALALFGWFVFMLAAMALAAARRRDPVPQEPDADEIDLVATFAPFEFTSTARAFRGGRVETWFGGGTLDLRQATLDPLGATIEVNVLFGGGNLVIPEDWKVEASVSGVGGVGDGRPKHERAADAPTLRVEGITLFGGWGITSAPADKRGGEVLSPG